MTAPSAGHGDGQDDDGQDDDAAETPPPNTVRVPVRRSEDLHVPDEFATVPVENARHWDARLWHDRPPGV